MHVRLTPQRLSAVHDAAFRPGALRWFRVGYADDLAPYSYCYRGDACGVLIEIIETALQLTRFRARFIPVPDAESLPQLSDRSIDAYTPLAVTPERRWLGFSQPLLTGAGAWFVRRGTVPPALVGSRGQITIATPHRGPLQSLIRGRFPHFVVLATDGYTAALDAVISGKADAAALNLDVGRAHVRRHFRNLFEEPDGPFCRLPIALAFNRCGSPPFVRDFNSAILAMKAKGALRAIHWRHLHSSGTAGR